MHLLYSARHSGQEQREKRRPIVHDGDVQTACQQACPTSAISFGNLVDPKSKVHRQWQAQQVELNKDAQTKDQAGNEEGGGSKEEGGALRGYRIFEELRPYPSVMYLERVRESAV